MCNRGGDENDIWQDPQWRCRFDRVATESWDKVAVGYDVILPTDNIAGIPFMRKGLAVAYHCTSLEVFEHLSGIGLDADLIFCPSAVATLDALARNRRTLSIRTMVAQGDTITRGCIDEVRGGKGISAELLTLVVGQTACYDLAPGTPVDFGMFS